MMLLRVVANGKVGVTYLSFYHVVPAPGVVGLLGVAALFGARRRRRR